LRTAETVLVSQASDNGSTAPVIRPRTSALRSSTGSSGAGRRTPWSPPAEVKTCGSTLESTSPSTRSDPRAWFAPTRNAHDGQDRAAPSKPAVSDARKTEAVH